MSWTEPLTPSSTVNGDTVTVVCRDATKVVASTIYKFYPTGGCILGEMTVLRDATVRQRCRALALVIRECVRSALALGMTHYLADAQPHMEVFCRLVANTQRRVNEQGHTQAIGRLVDLRAAVLARQDAQGRLLLATAADETEIATRVP